MRKISLIGCYDKIDLILYIAKILVAMDKKVLVVDSTINQKAKYIVNAAGVYADKWNNMVSSRKLSITPRKGEYYLLDKKAGTTVHHTIFQTPGPYGSGKIRIAS